MPINADGVQAVALASRRTEHTLCIDPTVDAGYGSELAGEGLDKHTEGWLFANYCVTESCD